MCPSAMLFLIQAYLHHRCLYYVKCCYRFDSDLQIRAEQRGGLVIKNNHVAHVKKHQNGSWDSPHLLADHLQNTAKIAASFASNFNSAKWGEACGFAHDIGKSRPKWQGYLRCKSGYGYDEEAHLEGKSGKEPHAIHGAFMIEKIFGRGIGRFLSYCIAGHHAGLPDWSNAEGAGRAALQYQLVNFKDIDDLDKEIIDHLRGLKPERLPFQCKDGLDASLWIRMLYSCLVDADFLDTEAYMEPQKSRERSCYLKPAELEKLFDSYINRLEQSAEASKINRIRNKVRNNCVAGAAGGQGIYTLTVPTGGGKTLSSLAFALKHAVKHNLDRVIYVIPYTSIIEQNAAVFKKVLGEDQVIEHHSNLVEEESTPQSRLAAENWDAPVIVTTTVQFFESLFAARAGRCRKLHNIAKAVVVLDEAQLLPVEHLRPILDTLQLLVDRYSASIVISTATQPAFKTRRYGGVTFKGLGESLELMKDEVAAIYEELKRVTVTLPEDINTHSEWEEVAASLKEHDRVLCIVSDRRSCRELHALMPDGTDHLSALMCAQHRSEVIADIKARLAKDEPVRVISTQLVEAGVDIDFPVVYRSFAGLDSIAQAAGRCNREGRLETGKLVVFNPPRKIPAGILRKAAETSRNILASTSANPLDHKVYERFFAELYWKANTLDREDIVALLTPDREELGINFRTAAERLKIIDDAMQKTVLVRYGESEELLSLLEKIGPERWLMRKLQRYSVNIYNHEFNAMLNEGRLQELHPYIYALRAKDDYSPQIGLLVEAEIFEPDKYIF